MATKTSVSKTRSVSKGPHTAKKPAASKKAPAKKIAGSAKPADTEVAEDLEWLEIKKPAKKAARKLAKLDLKPIKLPAKTTGKGKNAKTIKPKKLSPTHVINFVTEATELPRKEVKQVLDALAATVKASIMPGAVGGAFIPGIGAILRKDIKAKPIPAIKRGTVVEKRNPRTGEVTRFKHPGRTASKKPATAKARMILAAATRRAVFGTE